MTAAQEMSTSTLPSLASRIASTNRWSIDECCDRSGIPHGTWHRVVVRRASNPAGATVDKLRVFVERYG